MVFPLTKVTQSKLMALEALRGLLAVWVLMAHVAGRSLFDEDIRTAHLAAITEPLLPVYVFIILSGFVIFYLLDRETPTYRAFLTRRFFRLMPLYLVVLAFAATLVGLQLHALEILPLHNQAVSDSIKIHKETLVQYWPHLIAHVFLLHGLIPNTWLPDSNFAFLSQGWSISLEWQFYFVAPLLFFLIHKRHYYILAVLLAAFAAMQVAGIAGIGFLPNQIQYFLLGILSYYVFKRTTSLPRFKPLIHDLALVALLAFTYVALINPWPVVIWLSVLDIVIMDRNDRRSWIISAGSAILHLPFFQWLGSISYSIYLTHIPILYGILHLLHHVAPKLSGWSFLAVALPLTMGITIAISALTYKYIEKPGIRLGRTLSRQAGKK